MILCNKRNLLMLVILTSVSLMQAMVYDNRFFPLYAHRYAHTTEKPSAFDADLFLMTAHEGVESTDESVGIPEILGKYDLNKLANAITALGRPNPLIGTQFQQFIGREIPYRLHGKLEAQGVAFGYYQRLTDHASIGATWFAMHVFSRINFQLDNNTLSLTPEQVIALDSLRRSMQESIQLQAPKFSQGGFSDIDMFVRFGNIWNYKYKFRRIDAGVTAGILIPAGLTRNPFNPASVPFGGNGHWGAYVAADVELEMKEDWMVGVLARLSKRAQKTKQRRLTVAGEQELFGAVFGDAFVDPGLTFIIAPYFRIEDIRDGLGIQANYTVVKHTEDTIADARFGDRMPEVNLKLMNELSDWTSEYLTLTVFYDFARVRLDKFYAPIVSFMWDIPIQFFATERISKTNRVSLGIHFTF